jgi:formylglycine-generating enzyme
VEEAMLRPVLFLAVLVTASAGGCSDVGGLSQAPDAGLPDSGEAGYLEAGLEAPEPVDVTAEVPPSDGPLPDASPGEFASCMGGLACGSGSCCESIVVPGGQFQFKRTGSDGLSQEHNSTVNVSTFRLDKYEVTVGRFRRFVDAVTHGWQPAVGSGKHAHLKGDGVQGEPQPESGWQATWPALPVDKATWDENLFSGADDGGGPSWSWTPGPDNNESRPIARITWYEAYAFCIWDGGFLPTDREWQYAARGGSEERRYPWGETPPNQSLAAFDNNCEKGTCVPRDVGSFPAGISRWGHLDMAGNVWEHVLDHVVLPDPLANDCSDCADLYEFSDFRQADGGDFMSAYQSLAGWGWTSAPSNLRASYGFGVRCARSP